MVGIGTLISTIYHCNLRNFGILGDCGRTGSHNNHTNLVTSVWKGITGASATFIAKAKILTIMRMVNLVAKSNQN